MSKRFIIPDSFRVVRDTITNKKATYYDENDGIQFEEWLNNLNDENEQLHSELAEKDIQLDFLKDENAHMRSVLEENKKLKQQVEFFKGYQEDLEEVVVENVQLKEQLKIFEKFLELNDLDIDWENFCALEECFFENPNFSCKTCIYLKGDIR